jgi:hypothetical protein
MTSTHQLLPSPVTVATRELLAALRRAVVFTGSGDMLPVLGGVHLRYDGASTLHVYATDRHIAARITVEAAPDPATPPGGPWSATIHAADARLIVRAYRTPGIGVTHDRLVLLHDPAGELALAPVDPGDANRHWPPRAVRLTLACFREYSYPDLEALFAKETARTGTMPRTARVNLSPVLLARFAKHAPGHEPMRVRITTPQSAVLVEIGTDFLGMIMPVMWPVPRRESRAA